MAKKAGTQIIEALEALPVNADGTCTIAAAERDRLVKLAKRVDKRDEQNRKDRKKTPATKMSATRARPRKR